MISFNDTAAMAAHLQRRNAVRFARSVGTAPGTTTMSLGSPIYPMREYGDHFDGACPPDPTNQYMVGRESLIKRIAAKLMPASRQELDVYGSDVELRGVGEPASLALLGAGAVLMGLGAALVLGRK